MMKLLSKKQVAFRVVIIITLAEFLVMLFLQNITHGLDPYSEAAFDAVLLAVLSIPAIYIWVIKPFVDARDMALAQVSRLALTDPVTQLANRRLISTHLEKLITGSIRHKDYGAVLLVDLDGFKLVNDKYGHEAGDAVLVEVAKRLQFIIRSEDIVGRLGGDEFIVLLPRLGGDERLAHDRALRVAETLIKTISNPFDFNDEILHVGASIGICLLGFEGQDMETAIREADIAMYRAKEAGRGCAVFFEK
jgi:diguanylate cyclase (GGDEF)-like protein